MKVQSEMKYPTHYSRQDHSSERTNGMSRNVIGHPSRNFWTLACAVLASFTLISCDAENNTVDQTSAPSLDTTVNQHEQASATVLKDRDRARAAPEVSAFSQIKADQGFSVSGAISFDQEPEGMRITGELVGLSPGNHGFHIHEFGDCSAPDGKSAGGHFAPNGNPHGGPQAAVDKRHAGDLGNVYADENGYVLVNILNEELTLLNGPKAVIGKSVIVHAGSDDYTSQPSGDAGKRAGCGIIEQTPQSL